jgi:hypothetical protein
MSSVKKIRLFCLVFMVLYSFNFTITNAQSDTCFGSGIAFLTAPDSPEGHERGLHPVLLSPYGNYVAGVSHSNPDYSMYKDENPAHLYLWDTNLIDTEGQFSQPSATYDVPLNTVRHRFAPYQTTDDLAFSPDEQRIAWGTPSETTIFTVPQLQVDKTLSTETWGSSLSHVRFSWSRDGRFLGIILAGDSDNSEIVSADNKRIVHTVVWDTETDETYSIEPMESKFIGAISHFGDGWLIGTRLDNTSYFTICSLQLEECTSYSHKGMPSSRSIHPDNQIIISPIMVDGESLGGIWELEENGIYTASIIPGEIANINFHPNDFSPTGRYLSYSVTGEKRTFIWDFAISEPVLSAEHDIPTRVDGVPTTPEFSWFGADSFVMLSRLYQPDPEIITDLTPDNYFVLWLRLYQVGTDEPLCEVFQDYAEFPEFDIFFDNPYWDSSETDLQASEADNRFVLYVLGGSALLLPVIYE